MTDTITLSLDDARNVVSAILEAEEGRLPGNYEFAADPDSKAVVAQFVKLRERINGLIAEVGKPRAPLPTDWVCPNCGSDRIQFQMWVANITDEILDDTGNYAWCDACAEGDAICPGGGDGEFKHPVQRHEFDYEHDGDDEPQASVNDLLRFCSDDEDREPGGAEVVQQ